MLTEIRQRLSIHSNCAKVATSFNRTERASPKSPQLNLKDEPVTINLRI